MSDTYEVAASCIAPRFIINGTPSYFEVAPQATPSPGTAARIQGSPAGELAIVSVDGSSVVLAPSSLTAQRIFTFPDYDGQLATLAGSETFTNKTITATNNTIYASGLQTNGAAVVVGAATPPTAGQVLTAVNSTVANWQNPTGGSGRAVYVLQSMEINVNSQSWLPVGYMAWSQSRYSGYSAGVVVYYTTVTGALLNIRAVNANTLTILGQDIGATSGARSFSIVNPTADCTIVLQVQKQSDAANPSIMGLQIEFN